MKIVSGNCVSSKQISLSKAAKILSKFDSADNGASQVTSAYLHRATAAFNELNQLHRELKLPHSQKKHKRHKTEETHDDSGKVAQKEHKRHKTEETRDDSGKVVEISVQSFETDRRHKK